MNQKESKEKKKRNALNGDGQMRAFNAFVMIQIVCTFFGALFNAIVHGFSYVVVVSFSVSLIDVIIAAIIIKVRKPRLGAWIMTVFHGFILFPVVVYVSGMPSVMYLLIIIAAIGYISKAEHRIWNLIATLAIYGIMLHFFRMYSSVWTCYSSQEYATMMISFILVAGATVILETEFLNQYLIVNERIKNQNKAKTEFLARMSHEIRTPINGVIGMNEMILRETTNPEIVKYATNARSSGKVLLRIVNDILDIAKVESGKMEVIKSEYRLKDVVGELVALITARASAKGLFFEWEVDPNLPSRLYGDEMKLIQITANLLTNAVKYTDKGKITLTIGGTVEGDKLALNVNVKDTGRGIAKENQAALFDAFERLDVENNKLIEGTGLGLNITSKLLELMGSELKLDSEIGQGSDFHFTVEQDVINKNPIGELSAESFEDISAENNRNKFISPDSKVLVVDDNRMNLEVFENLLRRTQIDVVKAERGKECIELCQKETFDLIFLDHMMPGLDGLDTLKIMKSMSCHHLNKSTPVVALTANAISGAREMYLEHGFSGYLTKPIVSSLLEELLLDLLPKEKIVEVDEEEEITETIEGETFNNSEPDISDFPVLEGFDFAYAMRLSGDKEIVLFTLDQFKQNIDEMKQEIVDAYENRAEEKSVELLRIKVHALKGVCFSVGQTSLGELAKLCEFAARDKNIARCEALIPVLLEEVDKCKEVLAR